jgi:hypothetical protein
MKALNLATVLAAAALFFNVSLPSSGQSVAETYRKAAKAYRDAAEKTTADKKACYREWAGYYDCLADSLESGSNATCKAPTCKPGEPSN